MKIVLNGDPVEIAGPLTVSALLEQLKIDSRRVAVEHNLTVIKRGAYDSTLVNDGDEIEIVNFVGGGATAEAAVRYEDCEAPAAHAEREHARRARAGSACGRPGARRRRAEGL